MSNDINFNVCSHLKVSNQGEHRQRGGAANCEAEMRQFSIVNFNSKILTLVVIDDFLLILGQMSIISNCKLVQIIQSLIGKGVEGVYWDFKLKHHGEKGDLIHDVLCLANAEHDGPRFLIFGVEDGSGLVQTIENDPERRSQADIISLFRDNVDKFFQSRFPTFYLRTVEIDDKQVDVLIIENEAKKPYYLVKNIHKVKAHHIYSRVGDTNTPINRTAQPHEIERMWRERFGLNKTALERIKHYLAEPDAWSCWEDTESTFYYHNVFPEFTLRVDGPEEHLDSSQEWTRGEIRADNNYAGWYGLYCHQTLLKKIHYVDFDDHKKIMVAPDWRPIKRGRFYFYLSNSAEYAVQRFFVALYRTHSGSVSLRPPTGCKSTAEAQARWNGSIKIPVLRPDELEDFLKQGPGYDSRVDKSASDPEEQNELYLHNLLKFDDWKRDQD